MNRSLFALAFFIVPFATLANEGKPSSILNIKINSFHVVDSTLTATNVVAKSTDTLFVLPADPALTAISESTTIKQRLDSINTQIPMDYNEYVQRHIDLYANKRKALVARMLGMGRYYFPIFEKYLHEQGLPEELKYLPVIESALSVSAVSRVGATGLWQFMYGTAKMYDMDMNYYIDERRDPVASTIAATQFLSDLYDRYGDWLLVIAAYNCGPGNVNKAIARSGGSFNFWNIRPYLPRETANYVPAFIAATYAMTYAKEHDIVADETAYIGEIDTVVVDRAISLQKLATALDLSQNQLTHLNPKFRKMIVNGSAESPQTIILPKYAKEYYTSLNSGVVEKSLVSLAGLKENDDYTRGGDDFVKVLKAGRKKHALSYYKVRRGDNLGSIAGKYHCSTRDLKAWNNFRSNRIIPGQRLKIYSSKAAYLASDKSSSKTKTYKVRSGDTLSTIAAKFKGMTVDKLKKLNNIKSAKNIRPGMVLKVSTKA